MPITCSSCYYVSSITSIFLPLSLENQPWQLDIFINKKAALQSYRKTMNSFLDAGSHPNCAFFLYVSLFHIMFYQPSYHVVNLLFSSFLYITFLTSICEITYVPRGFRTDDAGWFAANWLQHFTTVPRKTTDIYCYLLISI